MEITTKKNIQEGVRHFFYPLVKDAEPMSNEDYNDWRTNGVEGIPLPSLLGIKTEKEQHNCTLVSLDQHLIDRPAGKLLDSLEGNQVQRLDENI
jgi:hypothetical protein